MSRRPFGIALLGVMAPEPALAAGGGLHLPIWSAAPFVLFLLCIAVLPLAAEHFWHKNRNKGWIAAAFVLPVVAYLAYEQFANGKPTLDALGAEVVEYFAFILLLWSLYTVSGGIVVRGSFRGTPLTNAAFLGCGAVLANVIGTTGASMVLIHPVLRINRQRRFKEHIPVFFIFVVSNLGGCLTPLGDPPLFLG